MKIPLIKLSLFRKLIIHSKITYLYLTTVQKKLIHFSQFLLNTIEMGKYSRKLCLIPLIERDFMLDIDHTTRKC